MPFSINRTNKECPQCKNTTIFESEKGGFYCTKCNTDFPKDQFEPNKTVTIEQIRMPEEIPETKGNNKMSTDQGEV